MNPFILVFFIKFCFSYELHSRRLTYISSSTDHLLSNTGFYDILIRGGETITASLSNGDNRLFIIIPSHPDFSIESISIDQISVPSFSGKKGFAINGNENVTFKLKSNDEDSILQVNAWLVPSNLCDNSAIYAYGSSKMKNEKEIQIQNFCVFSPTLDSKNNNFKVHFGIKNGNQAHDSSLYKSDFGTPQKKLSGSQVADYESGGPFFIQYNLDNANSYSTVFERKTKVVKFKDGGNKCTMNPFYRCSISDGKISCNDDQTGKDNSKSCKKSGISTTALALSITFGTIALLGAIAGIVACACLCSCCACCCCNRNRSKTKSKKKVQNESDDESVKSEKSSDSDKNSESSQNSKSSSENQKDDFDLYKQLKKLYEDQDKEIQKMQNQHLQQVEDLRHQKQVTKQQDILLDNFKQQTNEQNQQKNDQIKQLQDQQLQELLLLQQVQTNVVDPLLQ